MGGDRQEAAVLDPLSPAGVDAVLAVARAAGAAIMTVYAGEHAVEIKDDLSPLTAADKAAHEVIAAALHRYFPDIPLLSEEGRAIPWEVRRQWTRFWLVDPLDGTKEFIKRNGEFTVNIALIEDGRPVLGVVQIPATDRLYYGVAGLGAWRVSEAQSPVPIRVRRGDPDAGLTVVMSRSHPSAELDRFLRDIRVGEALPVGSSLKFCVVAEGKADLYPRLGPTMEWDIAAGQAVVEAAGGRVATVGGEPLRYNKELLLNPHFVVSGVE